MQKRLQLVAVVGTWFLSAGFAHADSWRLPEVQTYHSPSGSLKLTVVPRTLANRLKYFEDKVEGREPAGQDPASGRRECRGNLERLKDDGSWVLVWERGLVNEVAPVGALIADSGYVVTFDNWHSVGHGPHVIVIYAPDGRLVRSLTLRDFLAPTEIEQLPHSVSSIHWGRDHHIAEDGATLILRVLEPGERPFTDDARFRDVQIRLENGAIGGSPRSK